MEHYAILRVDLTTGSVRREMVPDELMAAFVGGKGLAAHYLATEMPAGADPLGPDNLLIFMTGPTSGIFPGTCRHAVVTKSPATGGFLDTYAGGYFAWELRKAGLLGIIVDGSAEHPVYLTVDDGEATLHDAADLAGRSIVEVDDDPRFADYRVVAIGPAGENRVGMSCIGNNAGHTKNGRSGFNGRGGSGAVMGAKNLKAIAVRGTGRPDADGRGQGVAQESLGEDPGRRFGVVVARRRGHTRHRRLDQRGAGAAHAQLHQRVVRRVRQHRARAGHRQPDLARRLLQLPGKMRSPRQGARRPGSVPRRRDGQARVRDHRSGCLEHRQRRLLEHREVQRANATSWAWTPSRPERRWHSPWTARGAV